MKILLDENLPAKIKTDFGAGFTVKTVRDMKWLGKTNGELLGLAVFNGFDIFITVDKNLIFQQNLGKFELKIIVLKAKNNKHQVLQPFIEKVKTLLSNSNIKKFNEIKIE